MARELRLRSREDSQVTRESPTRSLVLSQIRKMTFTSLQYYSEHSTVRKTRLRMVMVASHTSKLLHFLSYKGKKTL